MPSRPQPTALRAVQTWLQSFTPGQLKLLVREADSPALLVLIQALTLLLRPGVRLTPAEIRLYGLHRRQSTGEGGRAESYLGEAAWAMICRRLNRGSNRLLSKKLSLSYLLAGSRLGGPRTLAYLGVTPPLLAVPALHTGPELVRFLRQAPYPLFIKPLHGSQGQGCLAIEALDDGELLLGDGQRLPLQQAAVTLRHRLGRQAIVQERIQPHPCLQKVCGKTCATVRLLSSCEGHAVKVLAAILKLPTAGAMVDNLHAASERHPVTLAPVNPQTGEIGPWRQFNGACSTPVEAPLSLARIPDWPAFLDTVQTLHQLDRGALLLGWDVAVSLSGPMLVEVNGLPGIDLWQLAWGRGFRDASGRRLLSELEARARQIRHRRWRRAGRWLALLRPGWAPAGARRAG